MSLSFTIPTKTFDYFLLLPKIMNTPLSGCQLTFPSCPFNASLFLILTLLKIPFFHQDTRTQDTNTKTHNICLCVQTHRYARSTPYFQSLFYSDIQRIQSSYMCNWISESMESSHYIECEVAWREKVCLRCKVWNRCA